MAKKKPRISTEGGSGLSADNPFGSLDLGGLPDTPKESAPVPARSSTIHRPKKKGPPPRLDVRRLKGGKGGKTVTEISGFIGVNDAQLETLTKRLKATCGVGGTVKGRTVELQGDQRDKLKPLLEADGYRVVLSGG
ncbi:MAG: translation initiation factor [Verrucomicrobiota bacterium]